MHHAQGQGQKQGPGQYSPFPNTHWQEAHLSMAPGEMCTQDLTDHSSVLVSGQPGTGGHVKEGFALLLELLCKVSSKQTPPLLLYSPHMNGKV